MIKIKKFSVIILLASIIALNASCSNAIVGNEKSHKDNEKFVLWGNSKNDKELSGKESEKNFGAFPEKRGLSDEFFIAPAILARPSDKSVTVNILPSKRMELYIEYGIQTSQYTRSTEPIKLEPAATAEILINKLQPNTRYYYRIRYRQIGEGTYAAKKECTFVTQPVPGSTFTFDMQSDSHPEHSNQNNPELYLQTMYNVQSDKPDFYLSLGDDFSVDLMDTITQNAVEQLYINQRKYLGIVGRSSPIFLVNGNHEQAAKYVLNGTANNPAVWSQNARNKYFSQPAPDNFYTGDKEEVSFIGKLRDYYAWTWGDALFVVLDPYWHSLVPVDDPLKGGEKRSDMWEVTLGDEQYYWLKKTLEESNSKFKFVFAHHVLGTKRGGLEAANLYEWGGKNENGYWEFEEKRPHWPMTIKQLMEVKGVTIFFQGHDHIFAVQKSNGVVYQSLPQPGDSKYNLYNADNYHSGVKYPNSGHLRVTVSPKQVKVEYILSALQKEGVKGNGKVVYSYVILPKK